MNGMKPLAPYLASGICIRLFNRCQWINLALSRKHSFSICCGCWFSEDWNDDTICVTDIDGIYAIKSLEIVIFLLFCRYINTITDRNIKTFQPISNWNEPTTKSKWNAHDAIYTILYLYKLYTYVNWHLFFSMDYWKWLKFCNNLSISYDNCRRACVCVCAPFRTLKWHYQSNGKVKTVMRYHLKMTHFVQ